MCFRSLVRLLFGRLLLGRLLLVRLLLVRLLRCLPDDRAYAKDLLMLRDNLLKTDYCYRNKNMVITHGSRRHSNYCRSSSVVEQLIRN